jgi:hypothetical protein
MRIRTRLALFWLFLAAALAAAMAAGLCEFTTPGIAFHRAQQFRVVVGIGLDEAVLAALLVVATWRAWRPGRAGLLERAIPHCGPWVFVALACMALGPVWRLLANPDGLVVLTCLVGACGVAVAMMSRRDRAARLGRSTRKALAWTASRGPVFWCLGAFTLLVAVQWLVYRGRTGFADSASQSIQGVILSSGHFKWPAWEYPLFFAGPGMIVDGGWYSKFTPGHCLLMALGWLIHAPWVVGPALGALTLVVVWDCGRLLYGPRAGVFAALFLAAAPWWMLMSASQMNHVSTLLWLALSLDLALRAARKAGVRAALGAGFFLGWAAATRPLTALAFGAPGIVAALLWSVRRKAASPRALLAAGVGFLFWMALFAGYNRATTGDFFLTGYAKYAEGYFGLGFNQAAGYTPAQGALNLLGHIQHYAAWAPLASPGILLPLAWTLLFAPLGRREGFLLALWIAPGVAHFFYSYYDMALGPRFYYETMLPYVLLAAGGLVGATDRLERWLTARGVPGDGVSASTRFAVAGLCLVSVLAIAPKAVTYFDRVNNPRRLYAESIGRRFTDPRDVVFVAAPYFFNGLFLDVALHPEGPLFLENLGDRWNRPFIEAHPGRRFHFATPQGVWPYDEAPREWVDDPMHISETIRSMPIDTISERFHNPQGRPLTPGRVKVKR